MLSNNIAKFYTTKANVYRRKQAEDKYGGTSDTWEKMEWCIDCRLYSQGVSSLSGGAGYLIDIEGKKYPVTERMLMDLEVDLKPGDKVQTETDTYLVLRLTEQWRMKERHHKVGLLTRLEV